MDLIVYVSEAARLFVLVTLVGAAWSKSMAMGQFADSLSESFPRLAKTSRFAAIAIVGAEWLIAGLIATGGTISQVGLAAAFALFSVFAGVIALALAQGRAIICNCFGRSTRPISVHDLVRNALLIVACGLAFAAHTGGHGLPPFAYVPLVGVAIIMFLISTRLHDIHLLLMAKQED